MKPFLSVVIPAFNESSRIVATLEEVTAHLGGQPYDWEVVVVDDGSGDDTASLAEAFRSGNPRVKLLRVAHGGKGWAVKNGMLAAQGEFRFLCDADLSMPIEQVDRFLPPHVEGFDVAIGSREVPGARRFEEPSTRHLQGRVFNLVVRTLAVRSFSDTQCGFKCFRGEAAEDLFALQRLNGFGFDVEILFLAARRGLKVVELPIDWHYKSASKVRPVRDSVGMLKDVASVRWNQWMGRYAHPASTASSSAPTDGEG